MSNPQLAPVACIGTHLQALFMVPANIFYGQAHRLLGDKYYAGTVGMAPLPTSRKTKQRYSDSLSGDAKTRYLHKIRLVGGRDPYEIASKDWSNDKSRWPELDYFDIVNYLVYSLSHYTMTEMRSYKSLDSYNYFVHGWVHDVSDIVIDKLHLMTARVSYPQLLGLELWLAPTLFSVY